MKLLLVLFSIALVQMASAQKVIDVSKNTGTIGTDVFFSVGGEPFVNAKFVRLVEGTPYFKDEWLSATITMPGGKEYKNISVKIDLFDNELHYMDDKDVELVCTTPVKQIAIADALGNTYRFIHSSFISQTT